MQTQQSGKAPHRAFIKYSALTCAAAALTALTSPVQAQSSNVTMYGYIDVGVQSVTGYGSGNVTSYSNQRKTAMAEGYRNWLGFSGKEDLGDGLAATFNLQMRFQPGTGAIEEPGGTFFQGESTLGLSSNQLGSVRFGRALTPFWNEKWKYDPWYDSEYTGSVGQYQNGSYNSDPSYSMSYANWGRMQNAVFYDSPDLSGFKFHVAGQVNKEVCTAGTGVPCSSQAITGRTSSFVLSYNNGPFNAMASHEQNLVGDKIDMLGASYKFGDFVLMGTAGQVKLNQTYNPQSPTENDYTIAATYQTGKKNTLRFGYGRDNNIAGNGAGGNGGAPKGTNQSKVSFGDSYALSPRTNIYADIWHESIATVPTSNGVGMGINHTF